MIETDIPDIDESLRALSSGSATPSSREEYDAAVEQTHPEWFHFSWFTDGEMLYWCGNGDAGGDQQTYFKRPLSQEDRASLPSNFFRRRMPPVPLDRTPHPESPAEISALRRALIAALEKADSMPL
ncbi:MAG: hypothetical protein Q7S29_03900 [Candidatus Peribacter sp.]|nr:hypothetical protein [Candidatus Peribacter sp.]